VALCGDSPTNVFAVGTNWSSSQGIVNHYDGYGWGGETNVDVSNARGCALQSTNELWIAGDRAVAHGQGGFFMTEGADLTVLGLQDAQTQEWNAVAIVGSWVHVVGENGRVMTRDPSNHWTLSFNPAMGGMPLYAVAGLRSAEVLAAGSNGYCLHYDGAWAQAADLTTPFTVQAAFSLGDTAVYLGGSDSSEAPAIARLTRH
jgi:hypothetical protein